MKLQPARHRYPRPSQDEFWVRLRTPDGTFIFGFDVGKPSEYWRIEGMAEDFGNEEEAIAALWKRKQYKRR